MRSIPNPAVAATLPVVVVMLKAPREGTVKTRLGAHTGVAAATAIYRVLVEHQLGMIPQEWPVEIHFAPADAQAEIQAWLGNAPAYFPQADGDLGQRLNGAVDGAFQRGAGAVIVIGGDCPGLDEPGLRRCGDLLQRAEVVLGPAVDGGYYLIALQRPVPALFEQIPWSTDRVFATSLARAEAAGLRPALLEVCEDVDDFPSLQRVVAAPALAGTALRAELLACLPAYAVSIFMIHSALEVFQLPTQATADAVAAVQRYLVGRGLAAPDDTLTLERPGASNMNCVWRVRSARGSLILKQARPWVEKYPTIAAPVERAEVEAGFYRLARRHPALAARLPVLLDHDAAAHLLVLSDLAPVVPLETAYAGQRSLTVSHLRELAAWVARLHQTEVPAADRALLRNRGMRALNHAHIFDLPLRSEGAFDGMLEGITPGLAGLAGSLRADAAYVAAVHTLGQRYLDTENPRLIHGDLFLGSLLEKPDGEIMVIDPEFSFGGDPEYDLGVFYAHLILSQQTPELGREWLQQTTRADETSRRLVNRFAGVEIMRRLIGVAQLPLEISLAAKRALLERSRELVLAEN